MKDWNKLQNEKESISFSSWIVITIVTIIISVLSCGAHMVFYEDNYRSIGWIK